ncbi:ATP-grasp domain-containing protein [Streptomyces sp. NPDC016626]|uniref:ATP-grasp domain-containing protein n=1 Tax=Streptomyces sp. NPDC016626 TaxID=3364968 RepID=UPI00370263DB
MSAPTPPPAKTSHHLAVFGDLFDIPDRALKTLGDGVRITLFVPRSRLAACDGAEHAHAVVALADDADAAAWTAAVRAVHTAVPLTHALALVDHLAYEAAVAMAAVGVPFHTPATMERVRDKALMRRTLDERGLYPVPFRCAAGLDEARAAVAGIGLPCVFKPVTGTGSAGAVMVRDERELDAAYREASGHGQDVLVERFVTGPQFSVEALSEDGRHLVLAVTRKYSDPATLVELGHVMPAPLSEDERAAVARCAEDVLDAVGLTYGPSHTEVILGPDGPVPIETHARVGGDDIWLMVHAATGVDLDVLQPDQALGRGVLDEARATLAAHAPRRRHQAVWFGAAREAGTFPAGDLPGGEHVHVTALRSEGDPVRPLASTNDRVLKVRATGTTAEEALTLARETAAAACATLSLDLSLTDLANTV